MTEETRERWQAEIRQKMEAVQNEHAMRVGQIAIAWVRFHIYFRMWFSAFTAQGNNHAPAMREWDLIQSDNMQRNQKLRPALTASRHRSPQAIDSILWVCDWADQLAKVRNTFVHVAAFYRRIDQEIQVHFDEQLHLSDSEDRYRSVKKDPAQTYEALIDDLNNLSDFMHLTLNALVLPPKFGPLPPRPDVKIANLYPDLAKKVAP
jgi:hypothetical protein